MSDRFTRKLGNALLAILSLWCSLPLAGAAADSQSPITSPISAATTAATSQSSRYYEAVLKTRDYSRFGIIGNQGVVRPYVTAFYYPWYTDRSESWGRVTPEQVPFPLRDAVYPWLLGGATRVFQAPVIGIYDSARDHVLEMHLNWARNSGINALLVSEASDWEAVTRSMKRLNSLVKFIPVWEWAVFRDRDSANITHVKADLRVKFDRLWTSTRPSQPYANNSLTYGQNRLPVVYIYKRALTREWPAGAKPTREETNNSSAAYREAYAEVLLGLRQEGKEFIVIADISPSSEGITNSINNANGKYSIDQFYHQMLGPACKVFDGFLPYHKNFRLGQAIGERIKAAQLSGTPPFDNSREVFVHTDAELTQMRQDLENDNRIAKNYLTGTGVLDFSGLTIRRPTPTKICGITLKPGFFDVSDNDPTDDEHPLRVDRKDGRIYECFWDAALSVFPPSENFPGIVAITSFNEHFEGSGIEPTVGTGSKYLDLTRKKTLLFQNQPSTRLHRDIFYNSRNFLQTVRWGDRDPQDVPRHSEIASLVNLTAVLQGLYGNMWIFDEVDAFRNYQTTHTSVNPELYPTKNGKLFIKAGENNWHRAILLKNLLGSSVPNQTLTVRRRDGGDARLGIFHNGNRTANADIAISGVNRPFDTWLNFRVENSDVYRSGMAIFDIRYSVNPAYSTAITVQFVPLDERINLASGEHLKPYNNDAQRRAWNGRKNVDWYHRFDGRRRIEAFIGTHHLVIFLTGQPQAVIDGRCIQLPSLPIQVNGHWFVHEDVFLPFKNPTITRNG